MAAAPPRPKSFTSIRSIEEVDAHIAARRSRTPPPVWRKKSKKIQAIRQPGDDHLRQTTGVSGPSSSSVDPIISTVSAREEASAVISNESSDWNPNNLQRALSFKYIFNNDGSEGIDFIQSDTTSTSDYAACLTGSSEYDGPGFRPGPEFSGVASLKDWLPVFGPPNQPDAEQTGVRRSLLGAIEGCSNSAGESSRLQCEVVAPSLPNSSRVHSIVEKYGGSNDQLPGHSSSKGPNRLSSDNEGGESPVLDPEVLESFEKASEKLSEKEWYAMTKLESESESPRDFVHLMRSQRRSSSNSVEGLETPAMGDTTAAILTEKKIVEADLEDSNFSRPVDGSHSDNHTEERQFSLEQATGEFKKFSSERGDEERAVLYSTTWQSDAKAYEDCNAVKTLLLSLGTSFDERNISLHAEYEQELSEELEMPAVVPTLRVKDKCIVGLDGILQLHKKGMLGSLRREAENLRLKAACLCRGGKFLVCPLCKGRRKVGASSCRHCSGTGLIKCPNCSSS